MRYQSKLLSLALLTSSLFAGSPVAQEHQEHQEHQKSTTPATPPAAGVPSMGMGMQMASCPHMKAEALADQLLTSFAALEKEQNMAALKVKLATHGELLKQLKQTTSQKCPMMENMGGSMGCKDGMAGCSMSGGMQQSGPAK